MDNYLKEYPTIQGVIVIYSDFPINCYEIQQLLEIPPTRCLQKGEKIRENLFAKNSGWEYTTDIINSFDIEDVTSVLMEILKGKEERLHEYLEIKSLNFKIEFVIRPCEESPFPGMYFSREFISFCNKLNAEIDIDVLW